ncbi:MAG: rRNA maturation RNase YbeY [Acidimicrobiia bacterium]|nr:rRNA maturation RNase YbeY [Acidimicrobiia bacterium]
MSDPEHSLIFQRAGFVRRARIRAFFRQMMAEVAEGRPFGCLVTGDEKLRTLNRDFLGKDDPTDVLSFPSGSNRGFLGDVAISADRAREQASRYGHDLEDEICVLMLHGLLHLLGMDHQRDRGRMRRAETAWRKRLNLPVGVMERVHA